ncbi:uncharacterized protein LOC117176447 [Belonocnema kinseyi]|uniref:uncharacterized protein LOC117176447 n=1 Tax=Belonocnema kinseyi TaxID=2817044 RepID=UPI00143D3B13|nr:uncharacterized protein LOC117176447 [Belonocnema kinseyi]
MQNVKRAKEFRKLGYLEVSERAHALSRLLKLAQTQHFSREMHDIQESNQVSKISKLYSLNPFLDAQRLLRVGGRLVNAPVPFEQKHPIILSPSNPLTILIISNEHLKLMHGECQAVMGSLRNQYWPISCKNTRKNVLRKCVTCFRARPIGTEYIMGNLPESRVTPKCAFCTCGVDGAGTFQIKGAVRSKVTRKAYMCIFVCFVTKAVHIELAKDLSTDGFLTCLRRFVSRHGKCQHIYSDNGANFVGARNRLNELSRLLEDRDFERNVTDFLAQDQISWHLIPPNAPHFGGLWESAVKSAQKHVTRVIGETRLTYEKLYMVLTQVEA